MSVQAEVGQPDETAAAEPAPVDWRELGERVRVLRAVPAFRGLPRAELHELAAAVEPVRLGAGEPVCTEGEPAERAFLPRSGLLTGPTGSAVPAGPDGVLGLAEASTGGRYRATVRATGPAMLWAVPARVLGPARLGTETAGAGTRIELDSVSQTVRGDRRILHELSLRIEPGHLVAIVGASGSGKTTLLDAMAGVRRPATGTVRYDGVDCHARRGAFRTELGYVPQDDILHKELPLARTLGYAARLRLPAGTGADRIAAAVDSALARLDLTDRAGQRVGSLSGGERKRASIAVEMLSGPRVFFLDEPTSGLDPATAADLMRHLRRLADTGATVVLTTHNPADLAGCDQAVFLAGDGYLAFAGAPAEAREYFGTDGFGEIYERLAYEDSPAEWHRRFAAARSGDRPEAVQAAGDAGPAGGRRTVGALRQWLLLTRRNMEVLASNWLTVGIVLGSPVMVVAMFAVLFKPGAFTLAHPSPSAAAMILFWIAFGGFFFGLTYGLLQICGEVPIVRRERLVGLRLGPYVLSKVAVLLPVLTVVDALMLWVLRALDRLPAAGWGAYGSMFVTLLLSSAAALALGLLASAGVSDPSQASLALPMLCFPQVLFSGAFLPVPVMHVVGRGISYAMSNRWAFEALGHGLDLRYRWTHGNSPLGPPLLASFGHSFDRAVGVDWLILGGLAVLFLASAWAVLARKCRASSR